MAESESRKVALESNPARIRGPSWRRSVVLYLAAAATAMLVYLAAYNLTYDPRTQYGGWTLTALLLPAICLTLLAAYLGAVGVAWVIHTRRIAPAPNIVSLLLGVAATVALVALGPWSLALGGCMFGPLLFDARSRAPGEPIWQIRGIALLVLVTAASIMGSLQAARAAEQCRLLQSKRDAVSNVVGKLDEPRHGYLHHGRASHYGDFWVRDGITRTSMRYFWETTETWDGPTLAIDSEPTPDLRADLTFLTRQLQEHGVRVRFGRQPN